jgi:hypothetical protein
MADPTALVTHEWVAEISRNRIEAIIKTSEALVVGAYVGILQTDGKMEFMSDTASLYPVGVVERQSDGDNESLTGDGIVKAVAVSGILLKSKSVTGVTSAADVFKRVYASDGQTLTLTTPTRDFPVGYVKEWVSGTTCHVQLFEIAEMAAFAGL